MIDPVRLIARWNAKYNTERIKAALDDLRPEMLASVTATFPLITAMELQVKQVLDIAGASIIQYPFYLNFGREPCPPRLRNRKTEPRTGRPARPEP